ncbi:very short patch repair endonuclease [Roseovarius mucosus]|uniref:very short patch repair endonuclease n=1 Tax=Roseovarius mucosus TaxID=215743 RepID=UPI0035D038FC
MAGIRGKDTQPEMLIRRGLHVRGLRYRLHVAGMPGRPDIVLPRFRAVIFIHGCFWHSHEGCRYFRLPKTRTEFWTAKLDGNRHRDSFKTDLLKRAGWRVLTVWECATRSFPVDCPVNTIVSWLHGNDHTGEISGTAPG